MLPVFPHEFRQAKGEWSGEPTKRRCFHGRSSAWDGGCALPCHFIGSSRTIYAKGSTYENNTFEALEAEAARKAKANGTSSEEPVAVPQKKFFPSLYEGMELIPICRLE
ncbi:hypothetical protein M3Y99_01779100 [Aphelenchoides fujianensis]|nr:hypothetical protein M3Y99_01779100 [Aphelenchoides fujianensis]